MHIQTAPPSLPLTGEVMTTPARTWGALIPRGYDGINKGKFNLNYYEAANPFGTIPNDVVLLGWNLSPAGVQEIPGMHASGIGFERHYRVGTASQYAETHLYFVRQDGMQTRPLSILADSVDNTIETMFDATTIKFFNEVHALDYATFSATQIIYTPNITDWRGPGNALKGRINTNLDGGTSAATATFIAPNTAKHALALAGIAGQTANILSLARTDGAAVAWAVGPYGNLVQTLTPDLAAGTHIGQQQTLNLGSLTGIANFEGLRYNLAGTSGGTGTGHFLRYQRNGADVLNLNPAGRLYAARDLVVIDSAYGAVLKDTVTGNYHRLSVTNGALVLSASLGTGIPS